MDSVAFQGKSYPQSPRDKIAFQNSALGILKGTPVYLANLHYEFYSPNADGIDQLLVDMYAENFFEYVQVVASVAE